MALQKPYSSPYSTTVIPNAYFRIVETNFNFADSHGKVTMNVYESKEARDANKNPFDSASYTLTKDGYPAMDANGQPLTKQEDGTYTDVNGNTVEPTTPPFPGFDQLLKAIKTKEDTPVGTEAMDMVITAFYKLVKKRPEFLDSVDV